MPRSVRELSLLEYCLIQLNNLASQLNLLSLINDKRGLSMFAFGRMAFPSVYHHSASSHYKNIDSARGKYVILL